MDKGVLLNAIETYGRINQLTVAIEELSELQKEICKELRYGSSNIEEEIADVKIILAELELMFKQEIIDSWEDYKIERLKYQLKIGEGNTNGDRP